MDGWLSEEPLQRSASVSSGRGISVSGVRLMPVSSLRFWPENPRKIDARRLDDLIASMRDAPEMLLAKPLLATPERIVFVGNHRLRGAIEIPLRELAVITVSGLSDAELRMWALRDNNQWAAWDEPLLGELLAELTAGGIDLALSGFESLEIDRLLAGFGSMRDPDEVPPLPQGEPDSKPGEIYPLGEGRLLCGDSGDGQRVEDLFAGERAEVMWTDPPYGLGYQGKTRQRLTIANDNEDRLPGLLHDVFEVADRMLAPSARFYIASPAGRQGTVFRLAIESVGWHFHQACVWVKNAPVLGHCDHHFQHEDVLFGWTEGPGRPGRGRHFGSKWYGDNRQSTVFFHDRPSRSDLHPTVKPVGLIGTMLQNSSRRGDIVFDPFAGSGSTLIACEQLGRRCFAVEVDPRYCDLIRQRYREYVDGCS